MWKKHSTKKPFAKKVCVACRKVLKCGYVSYEAILRSLFIPLMCYHKLILTSMSLEIAVRHRPVRIVFSSKIFWNKIFNIKVRGK